VSVRTVTGELAPASKAFCHHYSGELIRLTPLSAPDVHVTRNHAVLAVHRSNIGEIVKLPAGELSADHYLVVPKPVVRDTEARIDVATFLAAAPPLSAQRTRCGRTERRPPSAASSVITLRTCVRSARGLDAVGST
jgi:hypothetical protein